MNKLHQKTPNYLGLTFFLYSECYL